MKVEQLCWKSDRGDDAAGMCPMSAHQKKYFSVIKLNGLLSVLFLIDFHVIWKAEGEKQTDFLYLNACNIHDGPQQVCKLNWHLSPVSYGE